MTTFLEIKHLLDHDREDLGVPVSKMYYSAPPGTDWNANRLSVDNIVGIFPMPCSLHPGSVLIGHYLL